MSNINIQLPFEVIYILIRLHQAEFEAYLVGGAVRDILLTALYRLPETKSGPETNPNLFEQPIVDYDFTTNATPQEIQQIFENSFYTNQFGTVGIAHKHLINQAETQGYQLPETNLVDSYQAHHSRSTHTNRIIDLAAASKIHESLQAQVQQYQQHQQTEQSTLPPFEITTFRSESDYQDYRRPEQVSWGQSINEDLNRRDFTINAMALTVNRTFLEQFTDKNKSLVANYQLTADQYQLIDNHHGLADLSKEMIRTVGQPTERFQEDALRMLRAIRFAAQLKMQIEPETYSAIQQYADLIQYISRERIRDEFLKMLTTDQPDRAIEMLDQTRLLNHFLPELQAAQGVEQGGHHDTDVWTHALDAVKACPNYNPIVRLAVLLHDIGKPPTAEVRNGNITFYNHEVVGARITDRVARRLKLSNQERERLVKLVRQHMFYYQPEHTDAAIRRLIKRVGLEYIDDILDVREADRLGSGAKRTSWRLEELKQRIIEQLNQPFDVTDLAIDGGDLIQELDLEPGPIIGQILNKLTEQVMAEPKLNQREALLKLAKKIKQESEKANKKL